MTEDILGVKLNQSEITDVEATFGLISNSTFSVITHDDLKLSSGSVDTGHCLVAGQTTQTINAHCTDLTAGTAYNLTVTLSVGSSPDVMIVVIFETKMTSAQPSMQLHQSIGMTYLHVLCTKEFFVLVFSTHCMGMCAGVYMYVETS